MKLDIVRKAFDGKTVLSDLSLDFPEGRTTLLMAPSGWGKTTLLRIASGLDRDFEGEVEKGGRNVVLFHVLRTLISRILWKIWELSL